MPPVGGWGGRGYLIGVAAVLFPGQQQQMREGGVGARGRELTVAGKRSRWFFGDRPKEKKRVAAHGLGRVERLSPDHERSDVQSVPHSGGWL